jgi:mannosyltransferase
MLNAALLQNETRASGRMDRHTLDQVAAIIPNLHWHYSGVTATNRMIAPHLAAAMPLAWFGRDAPDGIRRLLLGELLAMRFGRRPRIWHARRNNEMIAGLLLRWLGWPLRLVFTSAAQRRHSWLTRFLIARMDAVIATSAAAASYLRRPATVIHHGVDTATYAPPADRIAEYAGIGLPGRYGIGCFGRVRRQKGTDVFVEAMCRLLPAYPDFTAVIVGAVAPDQRAFAEALGAQVAAAGLSERIRFLGELPIAEVPHWYRRISIYAFTSRDEGFGLTLLEAMAAGTLVIASRAGAAETVIEHGVTGILVPPDDVGALVRALEPILQAPGQIAGFGRRARERIEADFRIEGEAQAILAVYRSVLRDGTPTPNPSPAKGRSRPSSTGHGGGA